MIVAHFIYADPYRDPNKTYRFAAFAVHPTQTHLIVAILEIHKKEHDKPEDVVNTLCVINAKTYRFKSVVSDADFYGPPVFSPDGTHISWQQWNHPDMPWEGAEIYIADVTIDSGFISVTNRVSIAGKPLTLSCAYPKWVDDNKLIFTSDESGFINPWKYEKGKTPAPVFSQAVPQDFGSPMWTLDTFPYALVDEEGTYAVFIGSKDGRDDLYVVNLKNDSLPQALGTPYVAITGLRSVSKMNQEVVLVGAQVDQETSMAKYRLAFDGKGSLRVSSFTALKSGATSSFSKDIIPEPHPLLVTDGYYGDVHAVYYEPYNPDYSGSSIPGEKPPCIVNVHGGPTALQGQGLDWTHRYYTSRGWGW